jgi:hypothetical protein
MLMEKLIVVLENLQKLYFFLLTLPLTATSISASSKTMQGAFPPSSKETYRRIILVNIDDER